MIGKHPTAVLVIVQLLLMVLLFCALEQLYDLIRYWPGPPGTEPRGGLVICKVCDVAWGYWFLSIPLIFALVAACAGVHRRMMRSGRQTAARLLTYSTICALFAAFFLVVFAGLGWSGQLPER